jgi:hypothetical protein
MPFKLVTPAACRVAALASARVDEARRRGGARRVPWEAVGTVRGRKRAWTGVGRRQRGTKRLTGEQSATGIGGRGGVAPVG